MNSEAYLAYREVNKGLCYYQLGMYEEAERSYRDAIMNDPNLVDSYYNLAILYNGENEKDKCMKLLETCLSIERNFSKASTALKKLRHSEQSDWYEWWFTGKKGKQVLGILIILSIFAFISSSLHVSFTGNTVSLTPANMTSIEDLLSLEFVISENSSPNLIPNLIILGLLTGILLLPSFKKVKVGEIELEKESLAVPDLKLEASVTYIQMRTIRQIAYQAR